jgi:hypothetical protein
MAYIRPYFINLLIPQQGIDSNYEEPSIKSMGGFTPYFIFISAAPSWAILYCFIYKCFLIPIKPIHYFLGGK